jgi:hypothetical protein
MGTCIELGLPKLEIPAIFLPNLSFVVSVSIGTPGITCCKFTLPGFAIPIPIPIPPAALIPLITAANAAIAAALPALDKIHIPDCSLE